MMDEHWPLEKLFAYKIIFWLRVMHFVFFGSGVCVKVILSWLLGLICFMFVRFHPCFRPVVLVDQLMIMRWYRALLTRCHLHHKMPIVKLQQQKKQVMKIQGLMPWVSMKENWKIVLTLFLLVQFHHHLVFPVLLSSLRVINRQIILRPLVVQCKHWKAS